MIRPFSIALLYGGKKSKKYAEIMRTVINERSVSYPLLPVLVESESIDRLPNDYNHNIIFEMLDTCDFAYLFLSPFYEAKEIGENSEKTCYLCKMNPVLEYGYLMKKLGEKNIKVIRDFPYDDICFSKFMFPSDLAGICLNRELTEELQENEERMKEVLRRYLGDDLGSVEIRQQASNHILAKELLFSCGYYSIDFSKIFSKDMNEGIDDYSLQKQHLQIWEKWGEEKKQLERAANNADTDESKNRYFNYQVVFCYERLLFVMLFKGIVQDIRLMKVNGYPFTEPAEKQKAIVGLYKTIYDYILDMDDAVAPFFEYKVQELQRFMDMLPSSTNPLIYAIGKNYVGLSYLNWYSKLEGAKKSNCLDLLEKAESYFTDVLDMCRPGESLDDIVDVLPSYAYYNRARARTEMGREKALWLHDYNQAIRYRERLSKNENFPEFIRLYFAREGYHAKNAKISSQLSLWDKQEHREQIQKAKEEIRDILEELKRYEILRIGDTGFFKNIKERSKSNMAELDKLGADIELF